MPFPIQVTYCQSQAREIPTLSAGTEAANFLSFFTEGETVVAAHPTTEQDAEVLRENFKPELHPDQLKDMIQEERAGEHAVEQAFASLSETCEVARNARTFYYEDLVDGAPGAEGKWGEMLASLKVWVPSDLTVIHADTDVLDTVGNPGEVEAALKHSPYKWMLEL